LRLLEWIDWRLLEGIDYRWRMLEGIYVLETTGGNRLETTGGDRL